MSCHAADKLDRLKNKLCCRQIFTDNAADKLDYVLKSQDLVVNKSHFVEGYLAFELCCFFKLSRGFVEPSTSFLDFKCVFTNFQHARHKLTAGQLQVQFVHSCRFSNKKSKSGFCSSLYTHFDENKAFQTHPCNQSDTALFS